MRHRSYLLPIAITLMALALLVACQTEILDQQAPPTAQTVADIGSAPVRIRYEMETITVTKFNDPPSDKAAFLYRNRSLPVVNRSDVELGI